LITECEAKGFGRRDRELDLELSSAAMYQLIGSTHKRIAIDSSRSSFSIPASKPFASHSGDQ